MTQPITLRQELLPPNQDAPTVQRVLALLSQVATLVEAGKPADREIARFNEVTGQSYDRLAFRNIESFTSYESFAAIAAAGRPSCMGDISDEEYIEIIRRLRDGEAAEVESHYWLGLLHINLACPEISDLIYWPKRQMAPAEVLRVARSQSPILVASSS